MPVSHAGPRRVGRPPLDPEEIAARVAAYCKRYGVLCTPGSLPPFPSGRRETRQHKDWLALYQAQRRAQLREAPASNSTVTPSLPPEPGVATTCGVCARTLGPRDAEAHPRPGRRGPPLLLHHACAELARTAERAGPEATSRLLKLLWPPGRAR